MVCGLPLLSVTTIVTCAPSPASLVPLMIGVLLSLCAATSTVSVGGVLSKSSELIVRVLPAASVAVAITEPTSSNDTSNPTNDQLPSASVVVVYVAPMPPPTSCSVIVISLPAGKSEVPLKVTNKPSSKVGVKASAGGVTSTSPLSVPVPVLPAASVMLALTL